MSHQPKFIIKDVFGDLVKLDLADLNTGYKKIPVVKNALYITLDEEKEFFDTGFDIEGAKKLHSAIGELIQEMESLHSE